MEPQAITLSAREKPAGGRVVPVRASHAMPAVSRLVVLVHGYNNTAASAAASYDEFAERIGSAAPGTFAFWTVAHFFWPGDKPWGTISGLSYPAEIGTAKQAARELRIFLAKLTGPAGAPVEIAFVTHSLGGRLVLELLNEMPAAHLSPMVPLVCLMAPAVPVDRVERGGALRAGAEMARRTAVFHSEHDAVLKWAFRFGQAAAGEGFSSRAVGRFGEPRRGLWSVSMPTMHAHGAYWDAANCAEEVARQLGAAPPRAIAARVLPRSDRLKPVPTPAFPVRSSAPARSRGSRR